MRGAFALVPGLGHWLHGRRALALALGISWCLFGAVLVGARARVAAALTGGSADAVLAALFLLTVLGGLPVLSAMHCRRLRRVRTDEAGEGPRRPLQKGTSATATARGVAAGRPDSQHPATSPHELPAPKHRPRMSGAVPTASATAPADRQALHS